MVFCQTLYTLHSTSHILIDAYIDSWTTWYMTSKKTISDNRLDVGWQYGIDVDKNSRRVQCKYSQKIFSGDIYCFKHHLACTRKNISTSSGSNNLLDDNDFDECLWNNEEDKGNDVVFSYMTHQQIVCFKFVNF
jgi:hypothetical protein